MSMQASAGRRECLKYSNLSPIDHFDFINKRFISTIGSDTLLIKLVDQAKPSFKKIDYSGIINERKVKYIDPLAFVLRFNRLKVVIDIFLLQSFVCIADAKL